MADTGASTGRLMIAVPGGLADKEAIRRATRPAGWILCQIRRGHHFPDWRHPMLRRFAMIQETQRIDFRENAPYFCLAPSIHRQAGGHGIGVLDWTRILQVGLPSIASAIPGSNFPQGDEGEFATGVTVGIGSEKGRRWRRRENRIPFMYSA